MGVCLELLVPVFALRQLIEGMALYAPPLYSGLFPRHH